METRFSGPNQSPGFLFWKVTNAWQRRQREVLAPLDLTHVQCVVLISLAWLEQTGEPVTQIQLATQASLDVMMVSEVVRTLEKKELLKRHVHPRDSRARVLLLTPSGQRKMTEALKLIEEVDMSFFSVPGIELPRLLTYLNLLDGSEEREG